MACEECHSCAYCSDAVRCIGGSYLVKCTACTDCTFCFGCVGLTKKEFHILNRSYSREAYFTITRALSAQLNLGSTP
jgi:hypothetical protein